jgi:hypothetical protein
MMILQAIYNSYIFQSSLEAQHRHESVSAVKRDPTGNIMINLEDLSSSLSTMTDNFQADIDALKDKVGKGESVMFKGRYTYETRHKSMPQREVYDPVEDYLPTYIIFGILSAMAWIFFFTGINASLARLSEFYWCLIGSIGKY